MSASKRSGGGQTARPAFLTKKQNGVSESPTQYRFEPDFSPAPPTTVCWQGDKRARKLGNKGFWLLSLEIDLAILGKKLTKELGFAE